MEHGWPGNRLWSNDGFSKAHESISWLEEIEMPRRLPPFAPLVAFDAVTRHGSFTRAAAELGVTQSAVSHQIRKLEDHFGVALLQRQNPGIEITPAGARLRQELAAALDALGALDAQVRRRSNRTTLRVGAGSALATWWLVRRLPDFTARYPSINVDLKPLETGESSKRPLDVRIVWSAIEDARRTSTQLPLFWERIFPVCAPHLLPRRRPLTDPDGLLALPLIHKGDNATGDWGWPSWFRRLGLPKSGAAAGSLTLDDMGLCMSAAADGAGVTLGRSLLVADAVSSGRLMSALANYPTVECTKIQVAQWPADLIGDRSVELFVNWLAEQAETTVKNVSAA
jgi:LysR family transcriptional regulator, glycine cleavage system transcriptional activator